MTRIAAPYLNAGNPLVLGMLPQCTRRVLDVGCGGGDNARRLQEMHPGIEVVGLTHSAEEGAIAAPHLTAVHVVDLENGLTDAAMADWGAPFDLLLFSHVLEHLTDPVAVLRRCLTRLQSGGHILIAVPNVLEWRTRMQFLRGHFVYTDQGILDRTHMRFFTYRTAPDELIAPVEGLRLLDRRGRGAVPLGPLRRIGAARGLCAAIDRIGIARRPNFCCRETAMLARWEGPVE
ncbi:Ubiquinone biosynthesis O-methyltransferase [Marinovum algicola]|uniref:Methyltransferase domain-containing protein n=1 Tax=Marinovum algicola TaxID=42444 RepID=A0A975WFF8_9RHOB|nr:methyltransferase domain-containing protein [Marinovum algicola]SEK11254.1 Methyltransferase domain-containing protein [Marinovum algicola]SLN76438.1 Ubiquinone biosynthesis O-methyltransferase [Marinovum algicola]